MLKSGKSQNVYCSFYMPVWAKLHIAN